MAGTVKSVSDEKWQRGESRERVLQATIRSVGDVGPSAVSGRAVAREAQVYNAQIQQMFGSVADLVREAVLAERDRFIADVFPASGLPDPLAIADHPNLWRSVTQVVLDPGPVDMSSLASGGPLVLLQERFAMQDPEREASFNTGLAVAWTAAPLGALIFQDPLSRGLGIKPSQWDGYWEQLGVQLRGLAQQRSLPAVAAPKRRRSIPKQQCPPSGGRQQLVAAAEELLEQRLETAVTGRELASHAGVNYGLVSHYFGSKSAVFDIALHNLHRRFLHEVLANDGGGPKVTIHDVFATHRAFIRAWAARLLSNQAVPEFELLGMANLVESLRRAQNGTEADDGRSPTARALAMLALHLGWTILEPLPTAANLGATDLLMGELRKIHHDLLTSN